jgi:hypothetical protein
MPPIDCQTFCPAEISPGPSSVRPPAVTTRSGIGGAI